MGGFTAGLVTGCLLGVCGTFLLLSMGAAFSGDGARVLRVRSLPGTLLSTIILLCIAAVCHRLNIGKDASTLLLLLAVLAVSKLEGLVNGLIATAIAASILGFWFFPPVGSLMIKSSSDRLALALFLLIATLGSRLIGRRESSAS
jgi:two-component system, OmpR family, sensor histidine kinase KdpD